MGYGAIGGSSSELFASDPNLLREVSKNLELATLLIVHTEQLMEHFFTDGIVILLIGHMRVTTRVQDLEC